MMYRYKLELFKRVLPPQGSPKKLWHEYVISNKVNRINGCRAGSYSSVFEFVTECIENLNKYYVPNEEKKFSPVHDICSPIDAKPVRTDW